MKEIIATTKFKRESGYLYFVGTDEDGFLTLGKAKMMRGGKKAVKPAKK